MNNKLGIDCFCCSKNTRKVVCQKCINLHLFQFNSLLQNISKSALRLKAQVEKRYTFMQNEFQKKLRTQSRILKLKKIELELKEQFETSNIKRKRKSEFI